MNRRRVLAVAGAGLTGGCLRLTGGNTDTPTDQSTPTQRRTPTESPSPTSTPDPGKFQYPPGTGPEGLAAPLGRAHASRLAFESFSVRRQNAFESLSADVTPDRMSIQPGEYTAAVFIADNEYYLRGLVAGERVYDFQQRVLGKLTHP